MSSRLCSCSTENGIVTPPPDAVTASAILGSHLFFLRRKSFALRLIRYTISFAVLSCRLLSTSMSSGDQLPKRTGLPSSRQATIFSSDWNSIFASFPPTPRSTFFRFDSTSFLTMVRSLSTSSCVMICMSRTGSTSPSTCVTSGSSNARSIM